MSYKFRSGQNDLIDTGTNALPTTGTISYWHKAPSFGPNTLIAMFVAGSGNLFHLQYYAGFAELYAGWYNGTDARILGGAPTDAAWNHILLTFSPTSTKLYLNGSQVGSTVTVDGTWSTAGASKYIGGNTGVQPADHYLAEIGVWNAILSGATIAALYAGQRPSCFPTNAVNYWALVANANDAVGSDNGTVYGAVTDGDHPTLISCGGGGGGLALTQLERGTRGIGRGAQGGVFNAPLRAQQIERAWTARIRQAAQRPERRAA